MSEAVLDHHADPGMGIQIASEQSVPDNLPFERLSLSYYRSRVNVEVVRVSSVEYGITLTYNGDKARDNVQVARIRAELKSGATSEQVTSFYESRVISGDYDKKLQPIIDKALKSATAGKRPRKSKN